CREACWCCRAAAASFAEDPDVADRQIRGAYVYVFVTDVPRTHRRPELDVRVWTIALLPRQIRNRRPLTSIPGRLQTKPGDDRGVSSVKTRLVVGVVHLDRVYLVRPTQVESQPLTRAILRGYPKGAGILVGHVAGGETVAR